MKDITGVIERGTKLGSKISYPTINIVLDRDDELKGVYVCEVGIGEEEARAYALATPLVSARHLRCLRDTFGVCYVGEKSTLPDDKFICEVFLFGNFGELYGKFARVKLLKKIRDVQKVKNLEELSALISEDVKKAKEWLSSNL